MSGATSFSQSSPLLLLGPLCRYPYLCALDSNLDFALLADVLLSILVLFYLPSSGRLVSELFLELPSQDEYPDYYEEVRPKNFVLLISYGFERLR